MPSPHAEFQIALKEHRRLRQAVWRDLCAFLPEVERHRQEVSQLHARANAQFLAIRLAMDDAGRRMPPRSYSPDLFATFLRNAEPRKRRLSLLLEDGPVTHEIISRLLEAGRAPIEEVAWLAEQQSPQAIALAVWLDAREYYIWEDKRHYHTDFIVERAGMEMVRISAEDLFGTDIQP